MRTMRFFPIGIAVTACRNFSTKGSSKPSYWSYSKSRVRSTKERRQRGPRIRWTEEQKSVLSAVSRGTSVFITGSAGTGKTQLLAEVVKLLRKLHTPSKVFVTASTGVAACALKGQTLHSFAGIGFSNGDPEYLLDRILTNKRACRRWQKAEALVIDEISMVDATLFDNLEYIARELRGVDKKWGGIQLVVSGDFFQLPPIPDNNNNSKDVEYAFEADCWNESFDLQIELTKIFRQSESRLIELLQAIRKGESDAKDLEFLEQLCSETECDPSVVQLFPLNKHVDRVNEKMLKSLQKDLVVYTAVDDGVDPWKRQLNQGIVPDKVSICEGARVMLVKNLCTWKGLVNGSTGTVVGFSKGEKKVVDGMCQDYLLPIVQFDSGETLTIEPEEWYVMDGDDVVARRKQIPLIPAWALSIHKCQGMTLDSLHTDLSSAFAYGMVYTALSRVRSLQGLHLSGFNRSKIQADPKVLQFYRRLALQHNNTDIDVSCIESKDSSRRRIGVSEEAGTAEKEYGFSLSRFLSRRLKKS